VPKTRQVGPFCVAKVSHLGLSEVVKNEEGGRTERLCVLARGAI